MIPLIEELSAVIGRRESELMLDIEQKKSTIQHLKRRVAELETLLEINDSLPPRLAPGNVNSKAITSVINLLLARECVSQDAIMLATGSKSGGTAPVAMSWSRKWLRESFDIEIKNRRGTGWYLTQEDKRKLRSALGRAPRDSRPDPTRRLTSPEFIQR